MAAGPCWALGPKATDAFLDPTAGGGSIPFRGVAAQRLTFVANDLNPVATFSMMKATIEWPSAFGSDIGEQYGVQLAS